MAREAWQQRGGVPETPQELNRYAYARNNPLRFTDPAGHHPCVAFLAGGPVGAGVAASCALFFLGVVAVTYVTSAAIRHAVEEGTGLPPPPLSSDTGGQPALPPAPTPDANDPSSASWGPNWTRNYERFYNIKADPDNYAVHHILPRRFAQILERESQGRISVHDPRWLREVLLKEPKTGVNVHQRLYTDVWQQWANELGRSPTAREVIQFAKQLEEQYAIEGTLFYRQGTSLPGRVDWDALLKLLS